MPSQLIQSTTSDRVSVTTRFPWYRSRAVLTPRPGLLAPRVPLNDDTRPPSEHAKDRVGVYVDGLALLIEWTQYKIDDLEIAEWLDEADNE